ncbi:MAG: outer membrane lipid asymmetry maintenance protein MlaD [Gammaproteobacteria bacterium]|nr:outer membrane lipid asymmetry maintenance protein MlaD [Gammaproteobacteria bacterium]
MDRKFLEIWVGVFVVAGMAALAMLAFKVGNLSGADVANGYQVKARFDNIGGLKVRSAVTMAGVRIGRVSDISFDSERYQALVTLNIDGRYNKIPNDTSASILTSGLLGEQYVGMEPGGAEEPLKTGDVIQITQSALVLEKLIGQFLFSKASEGDADKSKSAAP